MIEWEEFDWWLTLITVHCPFLLSLNTLPVRHAEDTVSIYSIGLWKSAYPSTLGEEETQDSDRVSWHIPICYLSVFTTFLDEILIAKLTTTKIHEWLRFQTVFPGVFLSVGRESFRRKLEWEIFERNFAKEFMKCWLRASDCHKFQIMASDFVRK